MSQQSHRSDPRILNRRTLQRDHSYLARVLRTGMDILDVGYGTGAITADIAKAVGSDGMAVFDYDWQVAETHFNKAIPSEPVPPMVRSAFGVSRHLARATLTSDWPRHPDRNRHSRSSKLR